MELSIDEEEEEEESHDNEYVIFKSVELDDALIKTEEGYRELVFIIYNH